METNELITALRRMKVETGSLICFGCGHEHSCSTRGCALIREAADRIDALRGPAIIPQAEMTREELREWFAEWLEDYYDELHTEDDLTPEVAESALVALRTPTREQVEGIRGEWVFPIFADQEDANDPRCQCSECGSIETPLARHRFCPACGAPMTDEAVDIRLKELEALKDGKDI